MTNTNGVTFHNPQTVAAPLGAYSHVAVIPPGSELLVVAGQVGVDVVGEVPAEPEQQYAIALQNVVRILESQGASARDIVKLNTYAVRPMVLEKIRQVRIAALGDIAPPSTFVYVSRLVRDDFLIEVEAWAVRPRVAA